jgi:hypothetical protein
MEVRRWCVGKVASEDRGDVVTDGEVSGGAEAGRRRVVAVKVKETISQGG